MTAVAINKPRDVVVVVSDLKRWLRIIELEASTIFFSYSHEDGNGKRVLADTTPGTVRRAYHEMLRECKRLEAYIGGRR